MRKLPNWVLAIGLVVAGCEAPVEGWGDFADGGSPAHFSGSSSGGAGAAESGADGGDDGSTGSSGGSSGGSSSGGGSGSGSGGSGSGSGGGTSADGGGPKGGDGGVTATCTSGVISQNGEGPSMSPGRACVSCHSPSNGQLQALTIGGTVYPTAHEPNDCNGVNVTGATVVVTDANKQVQTLTVNSVGNFQSSTPVATPYTASVVYNGKTLAMVSAQSSGDCNSCHSVSGGNGAPGRVMLP